MSDITFEKLTGPAAAARLEAMANLRLTVFREFPYLYDGSRAAELAYLRTYADSPGGCVILARDGRKIVGAITGIPLQNETEDFTAPFRARGWDLASLYYVGELLFLPPWRGRGLGTRLLALLAEHVRALGTFRYLACATVERPPDHPLRPVDFIPIERFCERQGFVKHPELSCRVCWRELDGVRSPKSMVFWIKELTIGG